ncbi:MAG: preprotein translocase subunit SecE [Myxococcales bacterium]|nr:preprotein translocase subunit SecE [Myxococcales bacterium]MCB9749948.1 preprotein translocase subunit SecE [Myxococcales bacterium]
MPDERDFDPSRWAHVAYFAFFLMLSWAMVHLTEDIWDIAYSFWAQLGRPGGYLPMVIGVGVSLLVYLYALRRRDWMDFVNEVAIEVSQVIWPTRAETRAATIVVISITLICSSLLWVMDVFWRNVTNWIYGI